MRPFVDRCCGTCLHVPNCGCFSFSKFRKCQCFLAKLSPPTTMLTLEGHTNSHTMREQHCVTASEHHLEMSSVFLHSSPKAKANCVSCETGPHPRDHLLKTLSLDLQAFRHIRGPAMALCGTAMYEDQCFPPPQRFCYASDQTAVNEGSRGSVVKCGSRPKVFNSLKRASSRAPLVAHQSKRDPENFTNGCLWSQRPRLPPHSSVLMPRMHQSQKKRHHTSPAIPFFHQEETAQTRS